MQSNLFAHSLILYSGLNLKVKEKIDEKKDETDFDFQYKADLGLCATARAKSWQSLSCVFSCSTKDFESYAKSYGFSLKPLDSDCPISLTVNGGSLSFLGPVSLMKSPSLTFSSSLRKSISLPLSIGGSLPSFSGSQKEDALFASLKDTYYTPKIEAGLLKSGGYFLCASKNIPFPHFFSLHFSAATGSFLYGREAGKSWFSKSGNFMQDFYSASCACAAIKSPCLSAAFTFGANQNPFGGTFLWTKDSILLGQGHFRLGANFFLADSALITASGKSLGIRMQYNVSPQFIANFSLLTVPCLFNAGLAFQQDFLSDGKRKKRVRSDLAFHFPASSILLSGKVDEKSSKSLSASFSKKIKLFTLRSSFKGLFSDGKKTFTLSPSISLALRKKYFIFRGNLSFIGGLTY